MPLASNYKASSQSVSRQRYPAIEGSGSVGGAGQGCARGSGRRRLVGAGRSRVGGQVAERLQNGQTGVGAGSPDGQHRGGRQLRPSRLLGAAVGRSLSQLEWSVGCVFSLPCVMARP